MTNVAAAIGCGQMERIDWHLQQRQLVASWYLRHLDRCDALLLPRSEPPAHHCYWMFTVLLRPDVAVDRDHIGELLRQRGIETRPVVFPVHWMPPYEEGPGRYPVAETYSPRGLSLPTHARLTEAQVEYVCQQLKEILALETARQAQPPSSTRQAA
jgi:perosamine synthetase